MTFYICRFNVLDGGGGGVGDSIGILRPCPDINPSVSAEFSIKKKIHVTITCTHVTDWAHRPLVLSYVQSWTAFLNICGT